MRPRTYPALQGLLNILGAAARDRGAILVEFAATTLLMLVLVLGSLDVMKWEADKNSIEYISQRAAICFAKNLCDPQNYAKSSASGLSLQPSRMAVAAEVQGDLVIVTVTYQSTGLVNWLPMLVLTSRASAYKT
jgi:Flp pilus assembly protein TadG